MKVKNNEKIKKILHNILTLFLKYHNISNISYSAIGAMAEWSNAAVLKTVIPQGIGGSNPSRSVYRISDLEAW